MAKAIPYEENHRINNKILEKKCSLHKEFFPEENECIPCNDKYFYKLNINKKDGLYPYCKRCNIEKMYKWRMEHPEYKENENKRTNHKYHNDKPTQERIKANSNKRRKEDKYLEWQQSEAGKQSFKKSNKKREKKKHRIAEKEWYNCKLYFNFRCAYCGLSIEKHFKIYAKKLTWSDFHKEHVIDDGKNDLRNCVPSCLSCNTSKHTKTLNEWYNSNNPNYTYERYHNISMWLRYDHKKYIVKKNNRKRKRYYYEQ